MGRTSDGYCRGGVPGQHEDTMRAVGYCKVRGYHMGSSHHGNGACRDRGFPVGAGASYQVTRNPCNTRLALWEIQSEGAGGGRLM